MRSIRVLLPAAVVALAVAAPALSAPAPVKLVAQVGPEHTITLKRAGKTVKLLKPGRYAITVRDRSDDHNFRLVGPGVSKTSSIDATGTVVWKLTFKKGLYRFLCDPHSDDMHGSFRVR